MPEEPTVEGAVGKYMTYSSILKYFSFTILLLLSIKVGTKLYNKKRLFKSYYLSNKQLFVFAEFCLLVTIIGEIMYARTLLYNPGMIIEAIMNGWFAAIGEELVRDRIIGITSLNNLFVLPASIYAVFYFNGTSDYKNKSFKRLLLLGVILIIHALLFAARMFFVYYLLILFCVYVFYSNRTFSYIFSRFIVVSVFLFLIIWIGETLRYGLYYAFHTNQSIFSLDTQKYVFEILVQGYLAADLNNGLIIFDCIPEYSFINSTFLGSYFEVGSLKQCSNFTSEYGTVNVLALWWFDLGWLIIPFITILGLWIGYIYKRSLYNRLNNRKNIILYTLMFPGIIAMIRINYFFLTIFLIPIIFFFLYKILKKL